jgi:hypothetical protein
LLAHSGKNLSSQEYKEIVLDCFKAQDRYPSSAKDISIILDFFRQREVQANFPGQMEAIFRALTVWKNTPFRTADADPAYSAQSDRPFRFKRSPVPI